MVHATLEGRRAAAAPLQDGHCHLASGLPGCGRNLLPLRPVAEPASHPAAHAGFYRGDGHVDDLYHHAPHDTLVLLLALPGSQVMKKSEAESDHERLLVSSASAVFYRRAIVPLAAVPYEDEESIYQR